MRLIGAILVLTVIGLYGLFRTASPFSPSPASSSAGGAADAAIFKGYAGSARCRECHERAYSDWQNSHHAAAERNLNPTVDRAAFDPPRTIRHGTQVSNARSVRGRFEVLTVGGEGKSKPYTVERVLGVDPLRQFLVRAPGGRFQVTELAYDPRRKDWFDVYGTEDRQPGEWGHWSGRGMTWNSMCAACHNSRLRKNYDERSDAYATSRAEMGVGCEACHGPLAAHVAWQQARTGRAGGEGRGTRDEGRKPERNEQQTTNHEPNSNRQSPIANFKSPIANRQSPITNSFPLPLAPRPSPLVPRPSSLAPSKDPTVMRLTKEQTLSLCGSCHARRVELTGNFQPGNDFLDHYSPVIPDETDTYYPDGQVRDEDFEYVSFLGSRMYSLGVRCLDCHEAHSGKTRATGNDLCLRCHKATIDPAAHGHHPLDKEGSRCVDCHMPITVYMARHPRRDHGLTIPDPTLTRDYHIPNACNRCHADQSVAWSIETVQRWYGARMQRHTQERARWIAQGRAGEASAVEKLVKMAQEERISLWRAIALGLLKRWAQADSVRAVLLEKTRDPAPLVRGMAGRGLELLAPLEQPAVHDTLERLLKDPARMVRIEAAWALRAKIDTNAPAWNDLVEYLAYNLDQPTGALQFGVLHLDRGDPQTALACFRRAVGWDTQSPALRQALAVGLSVLGEKDEAVRELQTACRLVPQNAELHFSLGLALAEAGTLDPAVAAFEKAVKLDPNFGRAWYNLGLARSALGEPEQALAALARAESADPQSADPPFASATILQRTGRLAEARAAAQRALQIDPSRADAAHLLELLAERPPHGSR